MTSRLRRSVSLFVAAILALGVVAQSVQADGVVGNYFVRGAWCSGAEIRVNPPFIAAVDTTAGEDAQAVTWRPVTYKWNGSAWVIQATYQYHAAYWAYDGDGGRYTYSATPDTVLMTGAGYWRVAIQIYWYATAHTPAGSAYVWGGSHYTDVGGVRNVSSYCKQGV